MSTVNRFGRTCLAAFTIGIALWAATDPAIAKEEPQTPKPSEHHKIFQRDVGNWGASIKAWHEPGAQAMESKGSEKNELLDGGMWLLTRFEGTIASMPYVGAGTFGYDPLEKKYVGTWVDSMSPHMMTLKYDYDPATQTMTGTGESRDPITGEISKSKHVSRFIDENTRVFEIHMAGKDGKEFKMLEINYKRRAD